MKHLHALHKATQAHQAMQDAISAAAEQLAAEDDTARQERIRQAAGQSATTPISYGSLRQAPASEDPA